MKIKILDDSSKEKISNFPVAIRLTGRASPWRLERDGSSEARRELVSRQIFDPIPTRC